MIDYIKRKLSLKVSLLLALITIPPMVVAAYLISQQEAEEVEVLMLEHGKMAAISGAKAYGAILGAGIDSGHFTLEEAINPVYEEIKGFDFGKEPRFHTKFDAYTDANIMEYQDAVLDSSSEFLYAMGNDVNGYAPTHDTKFSQAITNDTIKNRTKRKFTSELHQTASKSLAPVLVQEYTWDNGEGAWDVSAPIFVKGHHFGVFRVGVLRSQIEAHKGALLLKLAAVFGLLTLLTVGAIFFILRRSMMPLEKLATLANEISTGEGLDQPVKAATTDEIGQMAKSLNRLRASLQAAMGRLGE